MAQLTLCALPAFAALTEPVYGESSTTAWLFDEVAEMDYTEDEMLSAIEVILKTAAAAEKARSEHENNRHKVHANVTTDPTDRFRGALPCRKTASALMHKDKTIHYNIGRPMMLRK